MNVSIRQRLTLSYSAVIALVLVVFSAGVLWLQSRSGLTQLDSELTTTAATVARVVREEFDESRNMRRAAAETARSIDIPGMATAVLDARGEPLFSRWNGFPYDIHALALPADGSDFAAVNSAGRTWRAVIGRNSLPTGDTFYILVAAPLDPLDRERSLLIRTLAVAGPVVVLLAAGVCWWAASWALRPVTAMARQADAVTAQSMKARLADTSTRDELGRLARAFNRLLDRLALALGTQQQFMADASHELRTPVSVIRITADVTLARDTRDEAEYRDALVVVRDQSARLGRMVEDILVLARASAGGYPVTRRAVYLDDLITDCTEAMTVFSRPRAVSLTTSLQAQVLTVADGDLLQQLLTNLVQNAIRFTPEGGHVHISLEADATTATIQVADTGPGIPADMHERVFDRFVRLDPARRSDAGAGLGLPIARWIAELHGGTLQLQDNAEGGCTFVFRLPLVHPGDGADA